MRPTQGRHALGPGDAGYGADGLVESRHLIGLDVDEVIGRRVHRHALGKLFGQVALDQGHGDQHREADAEREDDMGHRRPRPMQVGERQPEARPALDDSLRPARPGRQAREEVPSAAEGREGECRADHEIGREAAVVRGPDRQAGKGEGRRRRRRHVACPGPAPGGGHQVAEEASRRHLTRPREGPERKGEGREQTEARRQQEGGGEEAGPAGDVEPIGQEVREHPRCQRPDSEAKEDAHQGDDQDLGQIDAKDEAAIGPQALEGGDGGDAAIEIGPDRVGDTHAADQEGGQPHEGEIDLDVPEPVAQAGCGVAEPAYAPARVRKRGPQRRDPGRRVLTHRQPCAVVVADQAAGPEQAGGGEAFGRRHDARAEGEERGAAVGLRLDQGLDPEACLADAHHFAQRDAEPGEGGALDDRAPRAVPLGEGIGER